MCQLKYKTAWVFDLDGTLTVSVHDFAYMRQALNMDENADILKVLASKSGQEKIELTQKLDQLEAFYAKQAKAAEGVVELIQTLAAKGCKLGIFTRNTKDMAILSLQSIGIAEHFPVHTIIGRDEAPHKPDPQGLFFLKDYWQVSNDEMVMVGDYKFDLEVGRNAEITTVHVSNETQRWPSLTDAFFTSLSALHKSL